RLQNASIRRQWADLAQKRFEWQVAEDEKPTTEELAEAERQRVAEEAKRRQEAKNEGDRDGAARVARREGERAGKGYYIVGYRELSSRGEEVRHVHTTRCGCVCLKCHPTDGPYPYKDAVEDAKALNGGRSGSIESPYGETICIERWECDCTCAKCVGANPE